MDPKPMTNLCTLPQVAELELVEQSIGFPFPAVPPIACSSLVDRLHVVAMDAERHEARHVALDRFGRAVGPTKGLPLIYVAGMTTCARELILVGARSENDRPVVLGVGVDGSLQWQTEVPLTRTPTLWPRPVCLDDRPQLIWVTESETSTLWLADVQAGSCGPARPLHFDDATFNLDLIPTGAGLTLARVHGDPIRLELLRIVEGKILRRETVADARQPIIPTIAVVADRYAVLWISRLDQQLCLQWFDWNLRPTEPPEKLVSGLAPARLRCARLIQGDHGYLAISYQTIAVGDGEIVHCNDGSTAIREPTQIVEGFLGAYDWKSHTTGSFQRIVEPGISYNTGDWVGNTLLLIHGINAPMITIFQAREKKRRESGNSNRGRC